MEAPHEKSAQTQTPDSTRHIFHQIRSGIFQFENKQNNSTG